MSDSEFLAWFKEQLATNQPLTTEDWARFNSLEECSKCKQVKRASAITECRACLLET